MNFFPKKQSTVKELWMASLQLYRKAYTQVWYLALIIGLVVTASPMLSMFYSINGYIGSKIMLVVLPVFMSFISVYFAAVMIRHIYNIGSEQLASLRDSRLFVSKKYITIAASIIIITALVILGIIIVQLVVISLINTNILEVTPSRIVAIFVMFVSPVLFFIVVLFSMVVPLILFDDQIIFGSIKGSCKLVWGNWWRTSFVVLPLVAIDFWLDVVMYSTTTNSLWYLAIGRVLFYILLCPLGNICVLMMFNDLKLRKSNAAVAAAPLETL